ncbi:MAG: helix-turn-helix transcriptional regulator [Bacteroidota bacterium]
MDELGKLLLVEQIYKSVEEVPLHMNPVLLIIAYYDGEIQELRHFYFHFRHDYPENRTQPLMLGTNNGSCGEYQQQEDRIIQFSELGCLTDPLSCMIAIHLVKELRANGHADVNHVHHMAISLMSYLVKRYREFKNQEEETPRGGMTQFTFKKIEDYVFTNISSPISISELAELTGNSVYHFARTFRQTTGETPYQFISRLKINQAKELLINTEQKVIEVAMDVGFNDPGHFTRIFKRQLGVTPTEFRKLLLEEVE